MEIQKFLDKIVITSNSDFDMRQTLECGQVFSFYEVERDKFVVVSGNKFANILIDGDKTVIETRDVDYFYNYFDLSTDYKKIKREILRKYPNFTKFFMDTNLRILRQDEVQTILSFIVSANNNIKRIKIILDRLSRAYGTPLGNGFYAFPTLSQLKNVTALDYQKIGAGYRSKYLEETVHDLLTGEYDITKLKTSDTKTLKEKLLKLKGVGNKVADCILFFGFSRTDVFPVDTWIVKAGKMFFGDENFTPKKLSEKFVDLFSNYSGYAQQYIFNYQISTKKPS